LQFVFTSVFYYIFKENPTTFASVLLLYRNKEQWAVKINTQGMLHQQPRKDPVKRLK
jgi:hypothetical protein